MHTNDLLDEFRKINNKIRGYVDDQEVAPISAILMIYSVLDDIKVCFEKISVNKRRETFGL